MAARSSEQHPGIKAGIKYARSVVDGSELVCRLTKLSCTRFLDDMADARVAGSRWEFRPDLGARPMQLAALLPNIKGPEAGHPLRLMAWQNMVYANVCGFVERDTEIRRFRQALVWVPRGNGKTTLMAPLVLQLTFVEGEGGAEGYAAAVTREQARILFDTTREMVRRSPAFCKEFGVGVSKDAIYQTDTASKFRAVSSDAKSLDGLNVQIAVCDEIGSHKTSEVYDVLMTAMGKRERPLQVSISTSTGNTTGIGKQLFDYGVRVLEGKQADEQFYALIYGIDDGDDPWAERTWIKANPSWGQAVQPNAIRAIMRQARNNPAQESVAKTRHLNMWMGADEALFSMSAWRRCADPMLSLDDFEGRECHLALDLASKTDLASLAIVFFVPNDQGSMDYTVFNRSYLNDAAVLEARNASYPGWAAEGHITVTPGNETDFATIEADVMEFGRRFSVVSVAYDPWAATQFAQRMTADGVPMVEYRANTQNFSEPTKEMDAAIRGGRLRHDGNPVLEWCVGNVVGRYDARSNVYPRKNRPEQKIDAAIASIMGIGRAMMPADPGEATLYETQSMRFL